MRSTRNLDATLNQDHGLNLEFNMLALGASAAINPTVKLNCHHDINLECDVHSLFLVAAPLTFCEGGRPDS